MLSGHWQTCIARVSRTAKARPPGATRKVYPLKLDRAAFSAYDDIAGMYHGMWGDWYLPAALPALEKLFFSKVGAGARVVDVCCGSGHVTQELVRRGYRVTGIDSSARLIAIAQRSLPGVDFRVQDVRELRVDGSFEAAISTFDSLNHMMTVEDLRAVFKQVHGALRPGGVFVFDMNLAEAYSADLRQWHVNIADGSVGLVRGTYDGDTKKAATELIWFVRDEGTECWRRQQSVVEERCYAEGEILAAVYAAGFGKVEVVPAIAAGVDATLGFGRIFVTAYS